MDILQAVNSAPNSSLEEYVRAAPKRGLFMEFGVHSGGTLKIISNNTDNKVYGFDSFEGLPEDWHDLKKGAFACDLPKLNQPNVILVKGWFDTSIPKFIKDNEHSMCMDVSFIHIDCDLYSSTKCVFDNFKNYFQNGSIIAFDELYNYGDNNYWMEHEYKAFKEFLEETGYEWECIGKHSSHQAAFRIMK